MQCCGADHVLSYHSFPPPEKDSVFYLGDFCCLVWVSLVLVNFFMEILAYDCFIC